MATNDNQTSGATAREPSARTSSARPLVARPRRSAGSDSRQAEPGEDKVPRGEGCGEQEGQARIDGGGDRPNRRPGDEADTKGRANQPHTSNAILGGGDVGYIGLCD